MTEKQRAPRNRTITLSGDESEEFRQSLRQIQSPVGIKDILDSTICQDLFELLPLLPSASFDLIVADPPYNLTKSFNGTIFREAELDEYENWLTAWLPEMRRLLKPTGSIYVCAEWRSSAAVQRVLMRDFIIRNRISWEREKGRGAKRNWKNNSEDIWFATASDRYVFNVENVMLKRRVVAPYTNRNGEPRDWMRTSKGNFRNTCPSNLWTDVTVPFWSMPENTDHPTQKPEKLVAKIILASSQPGNVVFDPFLGSGTTSVVAKKLGRRYVGIERELEFCCLAEKRLRLAESDPAIQGYTGGVFWERNTLGEQATPDSKRKDSNGPADLLAGLPGMESPELP